MLRLKLRYRFSIDNYVLASRIGGASQDNFYDLYKGKYMNLALSKLKHSNKLRGTTIVMNQTEAKHSLEILMTRCKNKIVACDTETIDLDIKKQVPVGRGKVICMSIFAGPEIDFGNGPRLLIDNFGLSSGLLDIFKPFLQSQQHLKVWHNYSFDRHVIYNHGIDVRGIGGDTMHMARLFDSSRAPKSYSLASLTEDYKTVINKRKMSILQQASNKLRSELIQSTDSDQKLRIKKQMICLEDYRGYAEGKSLKKVKIQQLFKRKKILQGGEQGKVYEFPSILTLHTSPKLITDWVQYCVLDSQSTYYLRQTLEHLLRLQKSKQYPGLNNMWQLYTKYWRPFAQVLTDMEREGMEINLQYIQNIKQIASQDSKKKQKQFIDFIKSFQDDPNIRLFNPSSTRQMQQLLHAPFVVEEKPQKQEQSETQSQYLENEGQEIKIINRKVITELPFVDQISVKNDDPNKGKKNLKIKVVGLGIPADKLTPSKLPSVDAASLRALAGNPKEKEYGTAYEFFKTKDNQQFGIQLSEALDNLCEFRNIQTLLGTFIQPLEGYVDQNNRVHCSLNINTQTGRLSARKPNLQNQPALEKDIYKIRKSFQASKGKKLIVADYGQLQLRVLAHMTDCKAMIQAFEKGGDFHSRTAIGMYPKIKKDIQEGKIILEWDKSKGQAPVPLLKDKYASERKKAKIVNFSIAYGKTAHGFAQDWNCTIEEAKQSLDLWYNQRPQVKQWQDNKKAIAKTQQLTQTLLGRFRYLFKYFGKNVKQHKKRSMQAMAMRRAINTPVQGGAADIVIAAMVNIHYNQQLRNLGWKLLLQVHDQLILQGPQQSAQRALEIVKQKMSNPFQQKLRIALEIDAKIGNNWYECK